MKFLRKNLKFILFFIFLIGVYIVLSPSLFFDATWEYGMAHAIRMGEIPYLDFNLITTPFYPFFHSLFLLLHDSFLMYLIVNAMIGTGIYYLSFLLVKEKSLFLIGLSCIFLFTLFVPSYNYMAFFFLLLLLVLEKRKEKDSWIGIVLGLLILTKHTIGFAVLFFSLLSTRDFHKALHRFLYALIPCGIFGIILLLTHSMSSFWDLCILGLFSFSGTNHSILQPSFFMSLLFLGVLIYLLMKKKKVEYFYALGSISFCIPIFDLSHFVFFFFCFLLVIWEDLPEFQIKYSMSGFVLLGMSFLLYFSFYLPFYQSCRFLKVPYFSYQLVSDSTYQEFHSVIKASKKYDNLVIIDFFSTKYDMVLEKPITYFDMLLTGNYGRKGTSKILSMIDQHHNTYFLVTKSTYFERDYISQMDYPVVDYIYEHLEKVEEGEYYEVFYQK